ncbi:MAG: CRISPR-associated endoribonuclease Cas6 [Armatimonadota bacterium]|nr:CRISPR-associated endoribonuclease Cas6 [Armatimonadota bacterium]
MRLQVVYSLDNPKLPVEYRRGFASLLKEAIKQANPTCFERYYLRLHTLKPFTFSLFFPELTGNERENFHVGSKAILSFSTFSPEVMASVYNGVLQIREYPIFENKIRLYNVFLRPQITIVKDRVQFKTQAPVLVNTKGNPNWYLLPGEEGFEEGLNFSVRELCRVFLGMSDARVEFHPIAIRRKVVRHYNMHMQGFVGIFELRGQPEVLNLIYQVGLGVRRSQGFGMLELVQTKSHKPTEEQTHE